MGHPLIDEIANREQVTDTTFRKENGLDQRRIIAILPGSRKQEISKMLEVMLSIVGDFKDYQFVIAGAPSQNEFFYQSFIKNKNVKVIKDETYSYLSNSRSRNSNKWNSHIRNCTYLKFLKSFVTRQVL